MIRVPFQEFIGDIALEDGYGIFDIVENVVADGRAVEVYIQLLDPELLTDSQYTLKVSFRS